MATITNQFSCATLAPGLTAGDCNYMAAIGMLAQGANLMSENITADNTNADIWIGLDGPNTFTFVNGATVPIILIIWYRALGDDQASFMNARPPRISYSLPTRGSAVEISLANDVPGAWSALYDHTTPLTTYGQIDNTIGEFSTGEFATVDVSRLVNMSGNPMTVRVSSGCVADMDRCVYACDTGTTSCGGPGTYNLLGCGGKNAVQSVDKDGNPSGGCQGWSNGGHVDVIMT
ncbi:hypothetical protein QBC47DRAFT_422172 [Echria macrotheca]|uniref:Uncharacterized protein n=1 Tax=Echria macrotheca TaxID=438768 RepID=A0AAJ0F6R9_9PEZI|nr:hypothetical protein QBC47DRAFT_422172 [Echria macrotheca]